MRDKSTVILGCGEIGSAIEKLCRMAYQDVVCDDIKFEKVNTPQHDVESLHICIPGTIEEFINIAANKIKKYNPEIVFIHSTTYPGATDYLINIFGSDRIVHSQCHGKHKNGSMIADMLKYPKFVATSSYHAYRKAKEILLDMGYSKDKIIQISSPIAGELCKILATSLYGYMIHFANMVKDIAINNKLNYNELMQFTRLETDDFDIRTKVPGLIGGHCVIPNIEILKDFSDDAIWLSILYNNEVMECEKKKQS